MFVIPRVAAVASLLLIGCQPGLASAAGPFAEQALTTAAVKLTLDPSSPGTVQVESPQEELIFAVIAVTAGEADATLTSIRVAGFAARIGLAAAAFSHVRIHDGATLLGEAPVLAQSEDPRGADAWIPLASSLVIPGRASRLLTLSAGLTSDAGGALVLGILDVEGAVLVGGGAFGNAMAVIQIFRRDIEIRSPAHGEAWPLGSTQTIRWATTEVEGDSVQIGLLSAEGVRNNFVTVPGSAGAYAWTLGEGKAAPPPGAYRITLMASDACTPVSCLRTRGTSEVFQIVGEQPGGSIRITAPEAGDSWAIGSTHVITWDTEGLSGDAVQIGLLSPTGAQLNFATVAGTDGRHEWSVGGGKLPLAPGPYQVVITGAGACTAGIPPRCSLRRGVGPVFEVVSTTQP